MQMRMEALLQQRPELRMKLAPQIIQSIEILQLPALELQQRLKQELLENPVLEMADTPAIEEQQEQDRDAEAEPQEERTHSDQEFEKLRQIEDVVREYGSQTYRRAPDPTETDRKYEAMQNTAARPISLQDYLFDQYSLLDTPDDLRDIAENIIYNIDDDGYLQYSLEEILESMDSLATLDQAQRALEIIQSLDPPGVGARDLKECLFLQMRHDHEHTLARRIIANHLEDLWMNRIPKIAKETGASLEEVREAIEFISHLNPKPGMAFAAESSAYVIPDIVVEYVDGHYEVRLEDDRIPRIYINSAYSRLLRDAGTSDTAKDYIRKKIQAARWLIESIEQRRNTLQKIARAIVDVQQPFLAKGIAHLVPLKMQAIAAATGVHVSTVCRAIADKYMQTPSGIFPLRFFFTGGTRTTDGRVRSRKSVKHIVKQVLETEDKRNPLSDDEIAAKLQAQGLDIARRTVTKYRKALGVPSSRQRRVY
ncbi:MAG TPA: RNA polymerase factor sigma-54 [Planctomycetota bacterium]|nr:RNA polymerase factor sigma-54 [Planctomycetota bacterium]HRT96714.1 RNA polymerase factor sigma-54 [Planctomycetota bacterium]